MAALDASREVFSAQHEDDGAGIISDVAAGLGPPRFLDRGMTTHRRETVREQRGKERDGKEKKSNSGGDEGDGEETEGARRENCRGEWPDNEKNRHKRNSFEISRDPRQTREREMRRTPSGERKAGTKNRLATSETTRGKPGGGTVKDALVPSTRRARPQVYVQLLGSRKRGA